MLVIDVWMGVQDLSIYLPGALAVKHLLRLLLAINSVTSLVITEAEHTSKTAIQTSFYFGFQSTAEDSQTFTNTQLLVLEI